MSVCACVRARNPRNSDFLIFVGGPAGKLDVADGYYHACNDIRIRLEVFVESSTELRSVVEMFIIQNFSKLFSC